ncbi:hypothetical protein Hanom_Chr00s000133g01625011 [Helianthus anomalus]
MEADAANPVNNGADLITFTEDLLEILSLSSHRITSGMNNAFQWLGEFEFRRESTGIKDIKEKLEAKDEVKVDDGETPASDASSGSSFVGRSSKLFMFQDVGCLPWEFVFLMTYKNGGFLEWVDVMVLISVEVVVGAGKRRWRRTGGGGGGERGKVVVEH